MTRLTLFNDLLNLYDRQTQLHLLTGPAFCMDNHRVGVTPNHADPGDARSRARSGGE
jgi:hypothetical protein